MKKKLCLLHHCNGIRVDSGNVGIVDTPVYYSQKNNIVMKLTNINNLLSESIKFIDCKKIKENGVWSLKCLKSQKIIGRT